MPPNLDFAQAAVLSLASFFTARGLCKSNLVHPELLLGIKVRRCPKEALLTASQMVRMSSASHLQLFQLRNPKISIKFVTTASSRNHDASTWVHLTSSIPPSHLSYRTSLCALEGREVVGVYDTIAYEHSKTVTSKVAERLRREERQCGTARIEAIWGFSVNFRAERAPDVNTTRLRWMLMRRSSMHKRPLRSGSSLVCIGQWKSGALQPCDLARLPAAVSIDINEHEHCSRHLRSVPLLSIFGKSIMDTSLLGSHRATMIFPGLLIYLLPLPRAQCTGPFISELFLRDSSKSPSKAVANARVRQGCQWVLHGIARVVVALGFHPTLSRIPIIAHPGRAALQTAIGRDNVSMWRPLVVGAPLSCGAKCAILLQAISVSLYARVGLLDPGSRSSETGALSEEEGYTQLRRFEGVLRAGPVTFVRPHVRRAALLTRTSRQQRKVAYEATIAALPRRDSNEAILFVHKARCMSFFKFPAVPTSHAPPCGAVSSGISRSTLTERPSSIAHPFLFPSTSDEQLVTRVPSNPDLQRGAQEQCSKSRTAWPGDNLKRAASGEWRDRDDSSLSRADSPSKRFAHMPPNRSPPKGTYGPLRPHDATLQNVRLSSRPSLFQHSRAVSLPTQSQSPPTSRPQSAAFHSKGSANLGKLKPKNEEIKLLITKQPPSQAITQQQLAQEITAIYKALVQIEHKCVDLIGNEFATLKEIGSKPPPKKEKDHWQALIALHRTLLHEHHDFFLASQHPSSGPALREIATKYSMPARMWKHGIHNFLELLRRHLPHSMEFMLAFIYLAYQMMALLFETVPSYEDTWIECLGDLARYRMAIEEEDLRDREIWTGVAKTWYFKAVDRSPSVGRLQHHLAILARTNAVEQLSLYARSLAAVQPFASTRGSILTLLEPMMARQESSRQLSVDTWFVKLHGLIFTNGPEDHFEHAITTYPNLLRTSVEQSSGRWREQGSYLAIANIVACLGWGLQTHWRDALLQNAIRRQGLPCPCNTGIWSCNADRGILDYPTETEKLPGRITDPASKLSVERAQRLFDETAETVFADFAKADMPHTLNFVFLTLTFMVAIAKLEQGFTQFTSQTLFKNLAMLLNRILAIDHSLLGHNPFKAKNAAPLPEEFLANGQIWFGHGLPSDWLSNTSQEEDERKVDDEDALMRRRHRIVWLGNELLSCAPDDRLWLRFADDTQQFAAGKLANPTTGSHQMSEDVGHQIELVSSRTKPRDITELRIVSDASWGQA
ncbi:hypothetical protein FH972_023829 [Carpinus fangiana]|uniref:DNA/RNA-binding domain-containing protein n=1 Tax=Carpinus fangiana TaxID=176857 RepID=A0A5N6KWP5_9ROSI|nr:hypothetical protein FH972_023829 [Carpinus fangiana]